MKLFVLAMVCCACAAANAAEDSPEVLAAQARAIFRTHCGRCHHGPGSAGGDFDLLKPSDLVENSLMTPNKPEVSTLYQRVSRGEMPPKPARINVEDVHALQRWIAIGATAFSQGSDERKHVSLTAVLKTVRDHLRDVDRDQRPYLRFLTLHTVHNNPQMLDLDLRTHRAAMSKVLNSLSWKPRIVLPKALDEAQTVFAIDIRDFDWDRIDGWRDIMKAYPYGVKYRNLADETLRKLDEDIEEMTGCEIGVIRADWFIATASRPPLYHTLLQIPMNAKDLERRVEVDIPANVLNPTPERVARAGFQQSGVSGQNRLLERHLSSHGYYWKSYDFKADSARTKLTRFPLGPLNLFGNARHPFAGQAFAHDGGEVIFSLPNGLQGYMLVDGEDRRIDAGPIEVVSDAVKTAGTAAIVNGVSCMSCHTHGMIRFNDTIRDGSSVFGDAEKHLKKLYPPKDVMDQLVDADEQRFLTALEKAVGPFLKQGTDKNRSIRDFAEPVGEVARLYRLGFLDLQTVAIELDIENPQVVLTKVGEKRVKQLGLEPLLKTGGVISRFDWEAVDGVSLMQEVARELRYTPIGLR